MRKNSSKALGYSFMVHISQNNMSNITFHNRPASINCPHCSAFAQQYWGDCFSGSLRKAIPLEPIADLQVAICNACKKYSLWLGKDIIFPKSLSAPTPHPDMPNDIKLDYEEARKITIDSPRSACVLLRLCVEKLCNELIEGSDSTNSKIKKLVENGLDEKIQQALDSVRVIGSEAIHSLEMDLRDDADTVNTLFEIVNIIIDSVITQKNKVENLYDRLPSSAKDAIKKRDEKK